MATCLSPPLALALCELGVCELDEEKILDSALSHSLNVAALGKTGRDWTGWYSTMGRGTVN